MPRKCSICLSEMRNEIDKRIFNGDSIVNIAQAFGLSEHALGRHKRSHITSVEEVDSPEAIVNCVATAIPLIEGDLTTEAIRSITSLGPLTIVISMQELGYRSASLWNSDRQFWRMPIEATAKPEQAVIFQFNCRFDGYRPYENVKLNEAKALEYSRLKKGSIVRYL